MTNRIYFKVSKQKNKDYDLKIFQYMIRTEISILC